MTQAEQIRRYLRRCKRPRTVADIHAATGIPEPSIRRCLNQHSDDAWKIVQEPLFRHDRVYCIGHRYCGTWRAL